jgi:diguanylate cyclase (GGDEF)-like protein
MTYLLALRVAFAAIVLVVGGVRPEVLGLSLYLVVAGSAGYVLLSSVGEWLRRRSHVHGHALISTLLLVDGLYLAATMYATGGTQSPMRFLIYLHLVAVSLLASYRTGLKVALWHSLLLFVGLYAQAAQLVPSIDVLPGRSIEFDRMPVLYVTTFWLFALATSVFSAINERELRNRRTDLQALVDIGARLDDATDPVHQSQTVLDGLGEQFGFARGVMIAATEGQMIILATRGTETATTAVVDPDAIIRKAWERRELLAVRRLDPAKNPALSAALPRANNLLISPLIADGRPLGAIVVEHHSRSIIGVERRVASVLGQLSAIAALNLRQAALLRRVQDLAEQDPLTGAANRRTFQLTLERVFASRPGRSTTSRREVAAILFIDLDDFKVVNDSLGHAVGDALLIAVTERIRGSIREGDLVARLGGDEFAILTEDDLGLNRSLAMAERLTRDLRAPFVIGGQHIFVTASIGIATAHDATESASDVIRNADVAMYMAKANGKAGFAVFEPGMHAVIRERHEIGAQLQRAVELEQMRVLYQPIVDLKTGELAGVEALARWQHPVLGLMQPGDFIEIAEDNGAILQIGRWILREACQMAGQWALDRRSLFLCVNVSAREIQQPRFVADVQEALTRAGLEPDRLYLEITETALIKATPSTIATLEALREMGVHVVIDDFGTGYFSLSHLRQFPVDMIKVASEFVQVPDSDLKSAAIAGAILAMGHSLEIQTVAEGIETADQAARMRALGCTYGQGYYFAKPQTDAEIDVSAFGGSLDADASVAGSRSRRWVGTNLRPLEPSPRHIPTEGDAPRTAARLRTVVDERTA